MRVPDSGTIADDINPAFTLRTLNYESYGILRIMGNAGFISSTVTWECGCRMGFTLRAVADLCTLGSMGRW